MDQTKSETEEITFPFVCFSVDDHEEAWSDIIVRLVIRMMISETCSISLTCCEALLALFRLFFSLAIIDNDIWSGHMIHLVSCMLYFYIYFYVSMDISEYE